MRWRSRGQAHPKAQGFRSRDSVRRLALSRLYPPKARTIEIALRQFDFLGTLSIFFIADLLTVGNSKASLGRKCRTTCFLTHRCRVELFLIDTSGGRSADGRVDTTHLLTLNIPIYDAVK